MLDTTLRDGKTSDALCNLLWAQFNQRKRPRPHVLIVDDDSELRAALQDTLIAEGFATQDAVDGKAAFDHIQRDPSRVALVLLNLFMPRMSGYELIVKLQRTEALRRIPILVMTAQGALWNRVIQQSVITKPFRASDLVAYVRAVLSSTGGDRPLD